MKKNYYNYLVVAVLLGVGAMVEKLVIFDISRLSNFAMWAMPMILPFILKDKNPGDKSSHGKGVG